MTVTLPKDFYERQVQKSEVHMQVKDSFIIWLLHMFVLTPNNLMLIV